MPKGELRRLRTLQQAAGDGLGGCARGADEQEVVHQADEHRRQALLARRMLGGALRCRLLQAGADRLLRGLRATCFACT